jgi:beta-N-acetylhexosaminidase
VYNPLCPVLGKRNRCFSNRTDSIAFFAGIVINAHHRHKLYTALKHFPGHGNSLADSHLGLVDVTRYWKEEELAPYRILINDSLADIIMTAHIVNQKLDSSGKPATLSKVVITDILRDKLQYKGVVITDDMQMHAISKQYGLDESIRMAILAGVDIVMFSNNIQGANNYIPSNLHATIKRLVLNGDIPMQRIQESYDRIMRLKLKN